MTGPAFKCQQSDSWVHASYHYATVDSSEKCHNVGRQTFDFTELLCTCSEWLSKLFSRIPA